jgi:hypothetical protein
VSLVLDGASEPARGHPIGGQLASRGAIFTRPGEAIFTPLTDDCTARADDDLGVVTEWQGELARRAAA